MSEPDEDYEDEHPIGCGCSECNPPSCGCRFCYCCVDVEYPGEMCSYCISGAHQG